MHEYLFEGQVFNCQIGNLPTGNQFHDGVDIALVEETDRAIRLCQLGDTADLKPLFIQAICCNADLFIVILLQGLDILEIDDAAFLDDRHPVAHSLHFAKDM